MLRHMTVKPDSPRPRTVRLFKNGRSQAVRIPREFELPGLLVTIRREGKSLVLEPAPKADLAALIASWGGRGLAFESPPDVPPEDVDL